jgi:hypothetical protein
MFTRQISSETEFSGTAQGVWETLSDLGSYPQWNPGFTEAGGRIEVGETLHLTFAKADGSAGTRLHPTVLVADPGHELRWLGRLIMPGILDAEHSFQIHETEPGRVRFVQSERFRGVLVPFLRKLIEVDTLSMFKRVNAALAERVGASGAAA